MSKFKINFTLAEKRKLWKANMSLRRLDEYTLTQIIKAIQPKTIREKEIREQFWKLGSNFLFGGDLSSGLGFFHANQIMGRGIFEIGNSVSHILRNTNDLYNSNLGEINNSINRLGFNPSKIRENLDGNLTTPILRGAVPDQLNTVFRLPSMSPIIGRLNDINKGLDKFDNLCYKTNRLAVGISSLDFLSKNLEKGTLRTLYQNSFENTEINLLTKQLTANSIFERTHLLNMRQALSATTNFTNLAESNLSLLNWENIGRIGNITSSVFNVVKSEFIDFSGKYSDLLSTIQDKPNWIYDAPQTVKLPAQEYYISSRILKIVSNEVNETSDPTGFVKGINDENEDSIRKYLSIMNKDLIGMWDGALLAISSDNPDKVRHMITSLRELYTHILHLLAPDDEFKKWDVKEEFYYNGKPTRRGRFLYLCRNLEGSNNQFANLLKAEINVTLAMIDLFQGGTHSVKSTFLPQQLEFIKIKADTTLRTFLTIEFEINRK